MTDIDRLLAIEEIKQLKARYFRCMDTKDWAGMQAVFTLDAVIDSSEALMARDQVTGQPLGGAQPDEQWLVTGAAKFVSGLKETLAGVTTVHHGHMPEIEVTSPTTAHGIWSMEDMLRWPPGSQMTELHAYGHYTETYERVDGRWLIKTLRLTRLRVDLT